MTAPRPLLTDDLLREALTEEPRAGLTEGVLDELTTLIGLTPQGRGLRIAWPWSSAMPNVDGAARPRRVRPIASFAVIALLVAIGAMIIIAGSIRRTHPLGSAGLIAFDSGGEIWVAGPDGSRPHPITSDLNTDVQPTFSPDGRRLAYLSLDLATSTVQLVLADPDGTDATIVATSPALALASGETVIPRYVVAWSPDASRLAFTASVGGAQQIFVVDADGTDLHQIGDPRLEGHDPAWSPDGARIAFVGGHFDDERGVYVMGADGSAPQRVGPAATGDWWPVESWPPAWSPDGNRIAFTSAVGPSLQVYIGDLDGTDPWVVSEPGKDALAPAWSPDGSRFAWFIPSDRPVDGRFAVSRLDGSATTILAPEVIGVPTWSPDGAKLIGFGVDVATSARDRLVVIDVASGDTIEIPAVTEGNASWQWLAP